MYFCWIISQIFKFTFIKIWNVFRIYKLDIVVTFTIDPPDDNLFSKKKSTNIYNPQLAYSDNNKAIIPFQNGRLMIYYKMKTLRNSFSFLALTA